MVGAELAVWLPQSGYRSHVANEHPLPPHLLMFLPCSPLPTGHPDAGPAEAARGPQPGHRAHGSRCVCSTVARRIKPIGASVGAGLRGLQAAQPLHVSTCPHVECGTCGQPWVGRYEGRCVAAKRSCCASKDLAYSLRMV